MSEQDPSEWIEYQQNEIDGAKEAIIDRRAAVSDKVEHGLLEGSFITEHDNTKLKAYLEGYSDALEFAANEVDRIENLAKYALEQQPPGDGDD